MSPSPQKKTTPEQLKLDGVPHVSDRVKLPTKAATEALAGKLTRRVARQFQQMRDPSMLSSGQDSGLKSVWDEICVQQQTFESADWSAHERMIERANIAIIESMDAQQKQVLWVLTEKGWSWHYDVSKGIEPDEDEAIPIDADLVEMLTTRLLSFASDFMNARIRKYLDRGS